MKRISLFSMVILTAMVLIVSTLSMSTLAQGKAVFRIQGVWMSAAHYNPFVPAFVGDFDGFVREPLAYFLKGSGEFHPCLAEKWEEKDNKLIVYLVPGVLWHDGSKFTSKDVLVTFQLGRLFGWESWKYITDVQTPDANTVVFVLDPKKPNMFIKQWILQTYINPAKEWVKFLPANIAALIKANDEKALDEIRTKVMEHRPNTYVGTGPFMVKSFVPVSEAVLVKFPKYRKADKVHFDEVYMPRVPEAEKRWALMFAEQLDVAQPGSPRPIQEQWLTQPYRKLALPSDLCGPSLYFNCSKPPLSQKGVRQAIAYVVDRQQARDLGMFNDEVVTYPTGILETQTDKWISRAQLAQFNQYKHDPAKAESILKSLKFTKDASGWKQPNGKPFKLEIIAPAGYVDWTIAAENIATQLTNFGIKTTARTVELATYWQTVHKGDFELAMDWWGGFNVHPYYSFQIFLVDRNGFGPSYSRPQFPGIGFNPEVEVEEVGKVNLVDLVLSLPTTTDPAQQKQKILTLAKACNEYLPILPISEKAMQVFFSEKSVIGWPSVDHTFWKSVSGQWYGMIALMMTEGMLKPAK